GVPVDSGAMTLPAVAPGDSAVLELGYTLPEPEPGREYFLDLSVRSAAPRGMVPSGHEVAAAQLALPVAVPPVAVATDGMPRLAIDGSPDSVRVSGDGFDVGFDLRDGTLSSLRFRGEELILRAPMPNFWRAPIDNDWGNGLPRRALLWRNAGTARELVDARVTRESPGVVRVRFDYVLLDHEGDPAADYTSVYTVLGSGDVLVANTFAKRSPELPELPRMGMNLQLPASFDAMTWLGRGPHENYWDRKTAADVGRYSGSVAEQYVPYIRPQENGYKTDVRWVALTRGDQVGLLAVGMPHLGVSAHHNVLEDFETPEAGFVGHNDRWRARNRHTVDVVPRDLVSLNLDYRQMGVGGDNSWGAMTHDEYRLLEPRYSYAFRLRAFDPAAEEPGTLARRAIDIDPFAGSEGAPTGAAEAGQGPR
ncbi:MAG: beta-galactosidase domain 4-containing protein, partial [Longimicrobiales bacterium]|nr:beta-galactosidase domain 4-containing protein [Longimicrobiales bacterium]